MPPLILNFINWKSALLPFIGVCKKHFNRGQLLDILKIFFEILGFHITKVYYFTQHLKTKQFLVLYLEP